MADADRATCPRCGAPLPADAPPGLCPRCRPSGAHGDRTEIPPVSPPAPGRARTNSSPVNSLGLRTSIKASAIAAVVAILLGGLWCVNTWQKLSDSVAH